MKALRQHTWGMSADAVVKLDLEGRSISQHHEPHAGQLETPTARPHRDRALKRLSWSRVLAANAGFSTRQLDDQHALTRAIPTNVT